MRGDAEPTWCTCSSALGRREMKSASADMAPSMSAGRERHSVRQDLSLELVGQLTPVPEPNGFPSTRTVGAVSTPAVRGGPPWPPPRSPSRDARARRSRALRPPPRRRPRPPGPRLRGRSHRTAGWRSKSSSWNAIACFGVPPSSTAAHASSCHQGVAIGLRERAVLHLHVALRRLDLQEVTRGDLEVAAVRVAEVLVDRDLRRGVWVPHDQRLPTRPQLRLGSPPGESWTRRWRR